jgi:hypothetical protein
MCGRYTHKLTWAEIVKLYQLTLPDEEPPGFKASYNVAPSDVMAIIRPAGNGRELLMAKWGLIPWWTKPESAGKPRLQHHQCEGGERSDCSELSRAVQAAALSGVGERMVRVAEAGR